MWKVSSFFLNLLRSFLMWFGVVCVHSISFLHSPLEVKHQIAKKETCVHMETSRQITTRDPFEFSLFHSKENDFPSDNELLILHFSFAFLCFQFHFGTFTSSAYDLHWMRISCFSRSALARMKSKFSSHSLFCCFFRLNYTSYIMNAIVRSSVRLAWNYFSADRINLSLCLQSKSNKFAVMTEEKSAWKREMINFCIK